MHLLSKMQETVLERTVKKPASNPIVADDDIQSVRHSIMT